MSRKQEVEYLHHRIRLLYIISDSIVSLKTTRLATSIKIVDKNKKLKHSPLSIYSVFVGKIVEERTKNRKSLFFHVKDY